MIGRTTSLVGLNPSLQNMKIPKSRTKSGRNHSNLAFDLLSLAPKTISLE